MIKFNLQLLDSAPSMRKSILEALSELVNSTIKKSIPELSNQIKEIARSAIKSEPEYFSLVNGELRYHFGIANISNVDTVVDKLVDTLKININPIKISPVGLSGGFSITMLNSNTFDGVLDSDEAQVKDLDGGYSLPWLQWLLIRGNEIIVKNYEVKMGPNKYSRTGNAIMVASQDSWRVPPAFVGSKENNWITRSLEKVDKDIISTIEKVVVANI